YSEVSIWFALCETLDVAPCSSVRITGPHPEERTLGRVSKDSRRGLAAVFRDAISKRGEPLSMRTLEAAPLRLNWRTPEVVIICGCLMAMLSFGPRSALGFFLTPMSQDNGWGRDVFSLALAVQNLLWGAAQPFAGAIADRYGALRVLAG